MDHSADCPRDFSEASLRLLLDTIPGLIAVMGANGAVEMVNHQILEYFGRPIGELERWDVSDALHPDDRGGAVATWKAAIESGEPYEVEHRMRRADGTYRWFQSRGSPLRDPEGRITRWYVLLTDVDERRRSEERLKRSEAELLEAQRLCRAGSWRQVLATGAVTVSPEVRRIRHLPPDVDPATIGAFETIHPDDQAAVERVYRTARAHKVDFEADYRVVLLDGTIKHIHTVGHPVLDGAGEIVEFVGTETDVTEQRQAREELEEAFEEIKRLKERLQVENVSLREELEQAFMFEEIVGSAPALRAVLSSVMMVAPTDSTVLISGETGTGKELIARAIHRRSRRAGEAFVSVNCAAIPPALIASELFGHEKGAFTGAAQQRRGRFELANAGTLFLDEIGEVPVETQLTLLRVLQERQLERLGGVRAFPVDVRVIAATNRDLSAAIAAGTFRADLFYRLNVFPIQLPPLRDRREDIPLLLEYFVKKFADKMSKKIRKIDGRTVASCEAYAWPGNIRELQNIVERSVILCSGDTLAIDEAWLAIQMPPGAKASAPLTQVLQDQERGLIEAALARSRGKVSGTDGAAARLGIPPSTLGSKLRQLRIDRNRFTGAF